MISVAVIGGGYCGINYIRLFTELPTCKVVLAADSSEARLQLARERFPLLATTPNWEQVVTNRWVDGVVVATPASSHFEITKRALLEGKHVLVEKPITTDVEE